MAAQKRMPAQTLREVLGIEELPPLVPPDENATTLAASVSAQGRVSESYL
jgi:hypothetical protein